MLDHGADLESHTKDLWTPLHLSAYNGHVEFVRELLEGRGAEVNARETTHGQTALHLCAKVIFLFIKKPLEMSLTRVITCSGSAATRTSAGCWFLRGRT